MGHGGGGPHGAQAAPRWMLEVQPSLADVSRTAAGMFAREASEAARRRGRFAVALAGGSTPRALYELLAREYVRRVDWSAVDVYFGDERCVPPDDPASNFAMAHESLLRHVPGARVYRIEGELPPDDAARRYDAVLRAAFPDGPTFDVALLGVGADGHTASLFPGSSALKERTRWAVAVPAPTTAEPRVPRVTVTFPVLERTRAVYFLSVGAEKREIVRRVTGEAAGALPAARVRGAERTAWLVDRAAYG